MITPINKNKTKRQFILFQILGIIKKLATISNKRIIGTISRGGSINDNKEILEAEKPNPLKPLTKDANKIIPQKNMKFIKVKSKISKNCISF